MKIQVLHDRSGKICAVFAPTVSKRKGGITAPSAEMTVIETTAPDIALPAEAPRGGDQVVARLAHLMENYAVRKGNLVPRSGKRSS